MESPHPGGEAVKMQPLIEAPFPEEGWRVFHNRKYVIQMRHDTNREHPVIVLSIRRQDRKPIMDWRDLQWIKNQLVGPEVEMVQLFPAESRLVDSANQFYLFGYTVPGYRFPFGFTSGRLVTETVQFVNGSSASEQRPFAEHVKPTEEDERRAREAFLELDRLMKKEKES